ncbi:MAG: DUF2069 domain-containing protein [Candidatus Obscuribacterales bacterium]|nr:DUF2069 domain-containing protein [Steroidobacteraceae bacterium]
MNNPLAQRLRNVTLLALIALLALVCAWQLFPTPSVAAGGKALLLVAPLLLPVVGLVRGKRNTYRWATLCVLPYIVVGLTEVIANPAARLWSAAILALSLLLFSALIGFLRASRT